VKCPIAGNYGEYKLYSSVSVYRVDSVPSIDETRRVLLAPPALISGVLLTEKRCDAFAVVADDGYASRANEDKRLCTIVKRDLQLRVF
jgi:hypothetical protein